MSFLGLFDNRVSASYGFEDTTVLGLNAVFENMFEVSLMPSAKSPLLARLFPTIARNIVGISIPSMGYDLQRSDFTRKFHASAESLKYPGPISITWMEDSEFTVRRFHELWKKSYYNQTSQYWVSGIENKFINLKIKINSDSLSAMDPGSRADLGGKQLNIELHNIALPKQLPEFKLSYGKYDIIKYDGLQYPVEEITSYMIEAASDITFVGEDT